MSIRTVSPAILGGIVLAAFLLVSIATATGGDPTPTVPNFTANATSGDAPLTVLFTDTSSGTVPLSFTWVFSDNPDITYSGFTVTHTFSSPGLYNVSHFFACQDGSGWINRTGYIAALAPVPNVVKLTPNSWEAGGGALSIAVKGNNFTRNSTVQWNGANRTTTYISPGKVTVKIRARDVKKPGKKIVRVQNPGPGGGLSNGKVFRVL